MWQANPETYTTKVLKALKLDHEFKDSFRSPSGEAVIEHIPSKKRFLAPYSWIELIKKHRGYMQLAAMNEFKKVLLNHENQPFYGKVN